MGLFDDVLSGISKEIGRVQTRSQEMMRAYTLNSQIRSLERKRTATLIEIGRHIFEKYQRNIQITEEDLHKKTLEIVEIEREIDTLRAELDQLQMQADPNVSTSDKAAAKAGCNPTPGETCPHCEAPVNVNKAFCPSCGGNIEHSSKSNGAEGHAEGHAESQDCNPN